MPRITLDIDSAVLKELKTLKKTQGRSLGQIVSRLLTEGLARRRRKKEPISFKWTSQRMGAKVDLEDKEAVYATLDNAPRKLIGDAIARKAARTMKQAGLKLDDLLVDLKKQRERYNRERNGA